MSLVYDEHGRPFLIVREQERKRRVTGLDAHRAHIRAARAVADVLASSLGPRGMDKIMVSPDGDVTVTNDGATILKSMHVEHEVAKLLVALSAAQDDEVGDGTTGVVVLAGALLGAAEGLLERGIHPARVIDGYERACAIAVSHLESISEPLYGAAVSKSAAGSRPVLAAASGPGATSESSTMADATLCQGETAPPAHAAGAETRDALVRAALTSLGSKVVSGCQAQFAALAVDAVLAVADSGDVDLERVRVVGKVGGELRDTVLVRGVVLDKEMAHPQMPREVRDARIALLNVPFEPPRPKTKHHLDISSADEYARLRQWERESFAEMVRAVKDAGANIAVCQWGFDDEATSLLLQHGLPAVRWVGGADLEHLAVATSGAIVARFADVRPDRLGRAGRVREVPLGTTRDRLLLVEECAGARAVTLLVRGGNAMIVEEARRALRDALCAVRAVLRDARVVWGGGAAELSASLAVAAAADAISSVEQHAVRAFAAALEAAPLALAANSGLPPIDAVAAAKAAQAAPGGSHALGIDCLGRGTPDMRAQGVAEPLAAKRQQLLLATQLVHMILKIDDVIVHSDI